MPTAASLGCPDSAIAFSLNDTNGYLKLLRALSLFIGHTVTKNHRKRWPSRGGAQKARAVGSALDIMAGNGARYFDRNVDRTTLTLARQHNVGQSYPLYLRPREIMLLGLKKDFLQFVLHGNDRTLEYAGSAVQLQRISDVRYGIGVYSELKHSVDQPPYSLL